ncbi:hypothetical protein PDE_02337 [Penicillium oxalicum 114-2]|uniref:Uncharacterized protein n=1 Tax=Penicillium oxalicum (strain 114-2 / CGMCC 5302) TaxID=933388 RepID=S7ZAY8_PENO1|nr:hypothetical protein PDE_02337 [Penicillium oxalicum 114-2]
MLVFLKEFAQVCKDSHGTIQGRTESKLTISVRLYPRVPALLIVAKRSY